MTGAGVVRAIGADDRRAGFFERTDMHRLDDRDADEMNEPLVAYVYGDTPPDFAAIAASGFTVVCLDSRASWFTGATISRATAHGLKAVGFPMSYAPASSRAPSACRMLHFKSVRSRGDR